MNAFTVTRLNGYSPLIGGWLGALEESRADLLATLQGLTQAELHARLVPGCHSIAEILWHMANVELWWIKAVMHGEQIDEPTRRRFGLTRPGDLNEPPADWPLESFLALMKEARQGSLSAYQAISDQAFQTPDRVRPDGKKAFSPEWILYNLLDHEANHRGQIAMLLRLMRQSHG